MPLQNLGKLEAIIHGYDVYDVCLNTALGAHDRTVRSPGKDETMQEALAEGKLVYRALSYGLGTHKEETYYYWYMGDTAMQGSAPWFVLIGAPYFGEFEWKEDHAL